MEDHNPSTYQHTTLMGRIDLDNPDDIANYIVKFVGIQSEARAFPLTDSFEDQLTALTHSLKTSQIALGI